MTFISGRRSRRQRLSDNCTLKFDIESIPICDGGTPIHVTKAFLDPSNIKGAVHQVDSSGVPSNTKQPEISWHCHGELWKSRNLQF